MKRRDFLKSTAVITGGGLLAGYDTAAQTNSGPEAVPGPKPNILFILVDELRYPTEFPDHIKSPGEFLRQYMPNVHKKLWTKGVKFGNYHTAANACTPSRGVMITGLYSQQSWLMTTILSDPTKPPQGIAKLQPVLNSAYPTFGKLLQKGGYKTPYFGKWHASIPEPPSSGGNGLEAYGFDFHSYPDPAGSNLQGTYGQEPYFHSDAYTVDQATNWMDGRGPDDEPWCLTVSLVNPHDREFFPAGTENVTSHNDFNNPQINPHGYTQQVDYTTSGPQVPWEENTLKSPPSYGYPAVPRNWESQQDLVNNNKPKTHTFIREFQQLVWGGITDDPSQDTTTIESYPKNSLGKGVLKMPFSYWQRGMDSYTQIMQIVDGQIGRVLDKLESLPSSIKDNTVVVFAADHGEYSGAHGMAQGKLGTVYEEAWHIPLIVVDHSHRFTGDITDIRHGLASSVDLMTFLVSLGYNGTRDWMTRTLADIYGGRHDMISMLKSKNAPGRSYVLYATDEIAPLYYNFNFSPTHIVGLRMEDTKLGVYADWLPLTTQIARRTIDLEFYDHTTTRGQLELANTADTDGRVPGMTSTLLDDLIPNELRARLPGILGLEQEISKIGHLIYRDFIAHIPSGTWRNNNPLHNILGYGREF